MRIILFKRHDNKISIFVPTGEILQYYTIYDIADKDVPENCPYWIIDSQYLPRNIPQEFWQINESEFPPDGYGKKSYEFYDKGFKYLNKIKREDLYD